MTQAPLTAQPIPSDPLIRGLKPEEVSMRFRRALAHVPPDKHPKIMQEASKRGLKRWDTRLENRLKAEGFISPEPKDRWQFFVRVMEPEMWAELKAKYPERYANLVKDFERLKIRALNGDFEEADTLDS